MSPVSYLNLETATGSYLGVAEPADTPSVEPQKKCRIYAAPRADNGQYRCCREKPLFYKEFPSLEATRRFWAAKILPTTSNKFGKPYEFSMVEADRVMWDFVGDPRYADKPILTAKASDGENIFRC